MTIPDNHRGVLALSGIKDPATLDYLSTLTGEHDITQVSSSTNAAGERSTTEAVRRQELATKAEPVKPDETTSHAFLMSASRDGFVDPGDGGQLGGLGPSVAEAGGVGGVGRVEGLGALGADGGGGAVVHRGGGVQPDPGMTVNMVVVLEERGAEFGVSWIDPNRPGKAGQYLRVLKFASLQGLSLGHVRTRVAAGHTEVDQQLGDRLEGHRRALVGVQGELIAFDALAGEGLGDKRLAEFTGLGVGDYPPGTRL